MGINVRIHHTKSFISKLFHPDFPFSPRRFPFFYGWVILVISTAGIVMSVPGQTMGISVFTDYLIEALDLSRVELSLAYMLGTIGSSLLLPWGGFWFDRKGARVLIVISLISLSITLFNLSLCDRVAAFLIFADISWLARVINFAVIFFGFLCLRFFGQGLLCMTSRSMLGKWFNRRRGFASGINGVVVTFTFSIAPLILNQFVNWFEWRGAWQVMACISFVMIFLCWLFFRDNPEECGLLMDGDDQPPDDTQAAHSKFHIYKEFTLREAQNNYTFWVFNLGIAAQALIITAVTFHIVSIGENMGLSRTEALAIFLPMSFVSIGTNFIFGWICDHIELKYTLLVMLMFMALGIGSIPYAAHILGRSLLIFGFGASGGIFGPLLTVVWPKFFGREHLGAVSGFNLSTTVFASALGPMIFGLSHSLTNSYNLGIYFCLLLPLIICIFTIKADNPQLEIKKSLQDFT